MKTRSRDILVISQNKRVISVSLRYICLDPKFCVDKQAHLSLSFNLSTVCGEKCICSITKSLHGEAAMQFLILKLDSAMKKCLKNS